MSRGKWKNKTEYKEVTTISLYPSEKQKVKRLGLSLSKFIAAAIAALPEEPQQENTES